MRYTRYDSYRNNDLLREVDANPNATELEIELAKRLEQRPDSGRWTCDVIAEEEALRRARA